MGAVDTCTKAAGFPASVSTPAAASSPPTTKGGRPMTLHLKEETSITVPCTNEAAEGLKASLASFVAMFKEKMSAEKSKRCADHEHTCSHGDMTLEVFCNPNAFSTIFDVKMFLTVKCGAQIKVSSDVALS